MTDARPSPLLIQLLWFIRLRWVAGLAVIAAALVDQFSLGWYGKDIAILIVGGAILAYNPAFPR